MNLTAFGNEDRLDVGIALDPAAITEPAVFLECLDEAFAALAPRSVAGGSLTNSRQVAGSGVSRGSTSTAGDVMRRLLSVALAGALLGAGGGTAVQAVVTAGAHAASITCPPGAFDDTEGVVKAIDKTIDKERARMEHSIASAALNPGDSKVHQRALSTGVLVRWSIARSADGNTYNFLLEMAQPSPTPSYVLVSSLSRTDAGVVNGVQTINKQISFDYNARGQFIPTRPTGNFDATIVQVNDASQPAPGNQTTLSVAFTNITVKPTDKHGPRTGSYTHIGEAGIGGSLDFHASIPVPCPGDPAGPVDITVQRRHVDDAIGNERTYRRDALGDRRQPRGRGTSDRVQVRDEHPERRDARPEQLSPAEDRERRRQHTELHREAQGRNRAELQPVVRLDGLTEQQQHRLGVRPSGQLPRRMVT